MIDRRRFIRNAALLFAAPAIVRASSLMAISSFDERQYLADIMNDSLRFTQAYWAASWERAQAAVPFGYETGWVRAHQLLKG